MAGRHRERGPGRGRGLYIRYVAVLLIVLVLGRLVVARGQRRAGQRRPVRLVHRAGRHRKDQARDHRDAGEPVGRPDPRPGVREDETILGNLEQDFDFNQPPRAPVLLATNPPTDSPTIPAYFLGKPPCVGCTTPPPGGPRQTRKRATA